GHGALFGVAGQQLGGGGGHRAVAVEVGGPVGWHDEQHLGLPTGDVFDVGAGQRVGGEVAEGVGAALLERPHILTTIAVAVVVVVAVAGDGRVDGFVHDRRHRGGQGEVVVAQPAGGVGPAVQPPQLVCP